MFTPKIGGRWTHFDVHIFPDGLVQPPTSFPSTVWSISHRPNSINDARLLLALRVAPCAVRSFWENLPRHRPGWFEKRGRKAGADFCRETRSFRFKHIEIDSKHDVSCFFLLMYIYIFPYQIRPCWCIYVKFQGGTGRWKEISQCEGNIVKPKPILVTSWWFKHFDFSSLRRLCDDDDDDDDEDDEDDNESKDLPSRSGNEFRVENGWLEYHLFAGAMLVSESVLTSIMF